MVVVLCARRTGRGGGGCKAGRWGVKALLREAVNVLPGLGRSICNLSPGSKTAGAEVEGVLTLGLEATWGADASTGHASLTPPFSETLSATQTEQ